MCVRERERERRRQTDRDFCLEVGQCGDYFTVYGKLSVLDASLQLCAYTYKGIVLVSGGCGKQNTKIPGDKANVKMSGDKAEHEDVRRQSRTRRYQATKRT